MPENLSHRKTHRSFKPISSRSTVFPTFYKQVRRKSVPVKSGVISKILMKKYKRVIYFNDSVFIDF